ncbi:MAG: GNAT family N-acetyltransferase [Deltaproteobacteria bacterium]|nr:GNAT family N-acetyltransferase [Deltaproteobacteria bacterium]
MGNRGRFGKYGEIKRVDRLRRARGEKGTPLKKEGYQEVRAKIDPARASDAAFIGQLSGKVFNIYGHYKNIVSRWFELGVTATLVALMDGKPAGFAMIGRLSNDRTMQHVSELLAIAVEQEKRRMGVGEMLIMEIEREAAELDVRRLFLHTATGNLSARRLFTRNGYSPCEIKRRFYPAGQDALMMSKEIARDVCGQRKGLSF